jgi:hypothetical protein
MNKTVENSSLLVRELMECKLMRRGIGFFKICVILFLLIILE